MIDKRDIDREYDEREGFDSGELAAPGADPNCEHCGGSGYVTDWVDYGSMRVPMNTGCECLPDEDKIDDDED